MCCKGPPRECCSPRQSWISHRCGRIENCWCYGLFAPRFSFGGIRNQCAAQARPLNFGFADPPTAIAAGDWLSESAPTSLPLENPSFAGFSVGFHLFRHLLNWLPLVPPPRHPKTRQHGAIAIRSSLTLSEGSQLVLFRPAAGALYPDPLQVG